MKPSRVRTGTGARGKRGGSPLVPHTSPPLVSAPAPEIDVSVVIVTHESEEEIGSCLRSIGDASAGLEVEVHVVDNASRDTTTQVVQEDLPGARLTVNPVNLGFGVACNQALGACRGRTVLFLNPDAVLKAGSLKDLLAVVDSDPGIGIVGCRLLREDGRLDRACRRSFPTPAVALYRMVGLSALFPRSQRFARYNLTYLDDEGTHDVDAVVGALMLVRREVLQRIGGFDPRFFLYGEDLDLCWRARESGSRVVYAGGITAWHRKRRSSRKRPILSCFHFHRAMLRFYGKNLASRYPLWMGALVRGSVMTRLLVMVPWVLARSLVARATDLVLPGRNR